MKDVNNIDLYLPIPNYKLGDRSNVWLESWRLIHYHLTISITIPRLQWSDKYALYSSNNILLKSKQDFVNVVNIQLNNYKHQENHEMKETNDNNSRVLKQIKFVIKV